ncbi:Blue light-and temperature-regulated antirepressor YcgF [Grimontia celer]|uniref:Blue light-and temperature-regulated antirepressor YcgF n=1 Tax=Grimontia celer TaxID=1796497 RepID=A0A128F921_9GAMM|nr:BLUF domain-containing protein [Grimontia celer]CZF82806.1 Blue light-and temperature-regulated antirepressor YcgF [Grimontia celer]
MIRIIYASSATVEFTESKLMQLLGKARQNNGELDVSGLLLYAKGNFFQILEGDEQKVDVLFNKIEQDDRHGSVVVLDRAEISKRAFPNWSMGFRNLESFDKSQIRGYNDFLDRKLTAEEFGDIGDEVISLINQFRTI